MWHHSVSTNLTFWILILVCDIQARVAAHGLGADVFADGVSVQRILLLAAIPAIIDPGDAVRIHLREDEDHVKIQVYITFSDAVHRSRTALEHTWWPRCKVWMQQTMVKLILSSLPRN